MRTVRIKLHTIDDLRYKQKQVAIKNFKRNRELAHLSDEETIETIRYAGIEFLPNGEEYKK